MASEDVFSSDAFRMYVFKVVLCTRENHHDWTRCPFAHKGEKARRRHPSLYCGESCPDFKKGLCYKGPTCEFAHGLFESWLHPNKYRTRMCKSGVNCNRWVCFFAHSHEEIRLPSVAAITGRAKNLFKPARDFQVKNDDDKVFANLMNEDLFLIANPCSEDANIVWSSSETFLPFGPEPPDFAHVLCGLKEIQLDSGCYDLERGFHEPFYSSDQQSEKGSGETSRLQCYKEYSLFGSDQRNISWVMNVVGEASKLYRSQKF